MNVLFVTRGFPSKNDPMRGNYEAVQAKALAKKGLTVAVFDISFRFITHFFEKRMSRTLIDGVTVYHYVAITPFISIFRNNYINSIISNYVRRKLFKRYVADFGIPDVMHAHILPYAAFYSFIKKEYGVPLVITEHWSKLFLQDKIDEQWLKLSWAYKLADQVICVSEAFKKSLYKDFGINCKVIHNMVEDHYFRGEISKRGDGVFRFVSVGALINRKAFDILIEAFAKAGFDGDVILDIIGEGEERFKLQDLINRKKLCASVNLLGLKTPFEISEIMKLSDCFVLSSRNETFGIVYIEAMAKGLPIIASRCGGPSDFVNKDNGLLVSIDAIDELSKALRNMVEHRKEYDSCKIRQYCYDNYSESVIADQIINVYQEVTKKKES